MIREDYIMRMIEDFVKALARVIFNRKMNNYNFAKDDLDNLSKLVTGLGIEHLKSLGTDGILYVLGMNKENETEKIFCAAKIIKEDGLILEAEGKPEDSIKSFELAKQLFEVISGREFEEKQESLMETEFLKDKLS